MTKLKTRLLKDLPVKTTPISDSDYVINSNNGTTKLKVKDITKNLDQNVSKLNSDVKEILEKGITAETVKAATEKEIQKQIANGNMANLAIAPGSITQDKLSPNIKFGIEDGEVTNRKLAKESITKEKIKDGEITPEKLSEDILIKNYVNSSLNLFNKNTVVQGYVHNGNGELVSTSNPSDRASDFIKVAGNTEYKRNPKGTISHSAKSICFYDNYYKFISGIKYNVGEYIFTTPSNCKYIRFSFSLEDLDIEYIKSQDEDSLTLIGYKLKPSVIGDGDITLCKLSDDIIEYVEGDNIFNKNAVVEGYIHRDTGKVIQGNNPSDRTSGFVEVYPSTQYERNPEGSILTGRRTICFYDVNKTYISGTTYEQGTYTFATPSNCKYIRFGFLIEDIEIEYIRSNGYKIAKKLLPINNVADNKQGMTSPDGTEHVISVTNDGEFIAIPKVHFDFPKEYGFTVTGRSLVNDEMYICGPRTKFISILNSKGYVKWYKPLKIGGYNFRKLTSDKGEIRYLYADKNGKSQVATNGGFTYNDLVIMNDKFVELKRVALLAGGSIADGFSMEDHDYIYFNDDHYIIPTYHPNIVTNVPNTGGKRCKVLNCVLQEIKNGKVVFHWESIDHPEFYTLSHFNNNFTAYHENQNIYNDYMHINSFVIDKRDGNLLVSARHIGFFKINRTTGELMWVIGKNRCDFSGVTANMIPSMQHDAKYNYDNSITLYDNSGCPTDNARICRYWLDEKNMILERFKEYITPYKRSPHMGGATLIDDELELFDISFGGDPGTFPVGFHEYSFKHKKEYLNYKHDNKNMFYRIFRSEKYGRQE